jgi:hypothetical protein
MFGTYDGCEVSILSTYEKASAHEAKVKPWRGNPDQRTKPMEKRSKRNYTIRRGDDGKTIYARHHNNDVITYHENGDIVLNLGGWDSQTTIAYMNELLGFIGLRRTDDQVVCSGVYTDEKGERHKGDFLVPKSGDFVVRAHYADVYRVDTADDFYFQIVNPIPCYQHRANRKAINALRRKLKPLIDYINSMCAVRAENGFIDCAGVQVRSPLAPLEIDITELDTIEKHALVMDYLLRRNTRYQYTPNAREYCAKVKEIKEDLDYVIKYSGGNSLFERVQLPWGTVRPDTNGKRFHLASRS